MVIPLWDSHVLVTGGASFVGSHIGDQLIAQGYRQVTVLDYLVRGRRENLRHAMTSGRVSLVEGDIRDSDPVGQLLRETDLVFHQVGRLPYRFADVWLNFLGRLVRQSFALRLRLI